MGLTWLIKVDMLSALTRDAYHIVQHGMNVWITCSVLCDARVDSQLFQHLSSVALLPIHTDGAQDGRGAHVRENSVKSGLPQRNSQVLVHLHSKHRHRVCGQRVVRSQGVLENGRVRQETSCRVHRSEACLLVQLDNRLKSFERSGRLNSGGRSHSAA